MLVVLVVALLFEDVDVVIKCSYYLLYIKIDTTLLLFLPSNKKKAYYYYYYYYYYLLHQMTKTPPTDLLSNTH